MFYIQVLPFYRFIYFELLVLIFEQTRHYNVPASLHVGNLIKGHSENPQAPVIRIEIAKGAHDIHVLYRNWALMLFPLAIKYGNFLENHFLKDISISH